MIEGSRNCISLEVQLKLYISSSLMLIEHSSHSLIVPVLTLFIYMCFVLYRLLSVRSCNVLILTSNCYSVFASLHFHNQLVLYVICLQ